MRRNIILQTLVTAIVLPTCASFGSSFELARQLPTDHDMYEYVMALITEIGSGERDDDERNVKAELAALNDNPRTAESFVYQSLRVESNIASAGREREKAGWTLAGFREIVLDSWSPEQQVIAFAPYIEVEDKAARSFVRNRLVKACLSSNSADFSLLGPVLKNSDEKLFAALADLTYERSPYLATIEFARVVVDEDVAASLESQLAFSWTESNERRFQKNEAQVDLVRQHLRALGDGAWYVRAYVAAMFTRHDRLLIPEVFEKLRDDECALVRMILKEEGDVGGNSRN